MKITPEVVAALETLKNAAENDFERHRIDVLENDLINPPKVEQIDGTHQNFLGFNFRQTKGGHYSYNMGLQQAVWLYHNGEIPQGHEIHHIDENKANNDIENLQALTKSEHKKLHAKKGMPVRTMQKGEFYCKTCEKKFIAIKTGKNYFCSKKCAYEFYKITKICEECGKEFKTSKFKSSRFCSIKCKVENNSRNHHEIRICPVCGKEFSAKLSDKRVFCSRKCVNRLKSQSHSEERICPVCGKTFIVKKSERKVCCSRSCATKHRITRGMISLFPHG